ncbi:hypothetical protein GF314_03595, partial [bacterium]|nr:hypothetical protein [bacterium]
MSGRLAHSSIVAVILGLLVPRLATGWGEDGGAICQVVHSQINPEIVADGHGGAIVAWEDRRDGDLDVYAQRVNASGHTLWLDDGIPVCTIDADQEAIALVADQTGGVFLAWCDWRGPDLDIYAQRLSSAGEPMWTDHGILVCGADYSQTNPVMVSDGSGGVIIAWTDHRGIADEQSTDIYVQRLNAGGDPLWTLDGLAVAALEGAQDFPAMIADGGGGAYLAWEDSRNHEFGGD